MLQHTKRVSGVDRAGERPRHLPDLDGVDLRTLRFTDDPELVAAVERVLEQPQELGASWYEGDTVHD
ncbi:hypothetical protein ABZ926_10080 [Streptomyces litmocidini]|uniref:FXSXX-COOH protein n=1 Tax=Streptomyces litmocidini TaxID=67318 RepID=A0ABW7U068_9ACTN|nr:hypothetical protein [Streptomyces sp. PanSC19]ROQ34329.1 hypothetical protein EDD98_3368 [Streptomyces sp. PanSC19]